MWNTNERYTIHNTQYDMNFFHRDMSALVGFGTNSIYAWDISWSSKTSLRDGAYQIRTAVQWMSNIFSWTMNRSDFWLPLTAKCSRLEFWLRFKIESFIDRWSTSYGSKMHNRSIFYGRCLSVERNSLN